jgi:hypothetical protein
MSWRKQLTAVECLRWLKGKPSAFDPPTAEESSGAPKQKAFDPLTAEESSGAPKKGAFYPPTAEESSDAPKKVRSIRRRLKNRRTI